MENLRNPFLMMVLVYSGLLGFAQDEDMQQAWMKSMMPGEPHAKMAKMVGEWDVVSKVWMDPASPPMESKATTTFKMILGGRYLQQELTGNMMGMEFSGIGTEAYDNVRGVYLGTWIDSMGTSITYSEGSYDEATKILHFKGSMTDVMAGGVAPYRYTQEMKDDDTMVFTMYNTVEGQEMKTMEMIYTRKK